MPGFCWQVAQFLDTQGFFEFLERGHGSEEHGLNLLDKLQDALARGQDPYAVLPVSTSELEILTIDDLPSGNAGGCGSCILCPYHSTRNDVKDVLIVPIFMHNNKDSLFKNSPCHL